MAVFLGQCWHLDPHSPVVIKISADNSLLQLFHQSSKHFAINTNILFMKKQLIWVLESRKSLHYWWSHISFAPECKELTCMLDLYYTGGVSHLLLLGVCTGPHKGGYTADLDYPSEPYHRNALLSSLIMHDDHRQLQTIKSKSTQHINTHVYRKFKMGHIHTMGLNICTSGVFLTNGKIKRSTRSPG